MVVGWLYSRVSNGRELLKTCASNEFGVEQGPSPFLVHGWCTSIGAGPEAREALDLRKYSKPTMHNAHHNTMVEVGAGC